jgi:hypothetical protein
MQFAQATAKCRASKELSELREWANSHGYCTTASGAPKGQQQMTVNTLI